MPEWVVHHGDCRDVLAAMEPESVDSGVGDPPYGLGFMGAEWDKFGKGGMKASTIAAQKAAEERNEPFGRSGKAAAPSPGEKASFKAFMREVASATYRVLKPGAHVLMFGGTRTYHWLADAWEDAGFEVRDMLSWLYGTGFPKNVDVAKTIAKGMGVKATRLEPATLGMANNDNWNELKNRLVFPPFEEWPPEVQEAARAWLGYGSALKPACEPIMLARKPITQPIYRNVLEYGTAALNIAESRVGSDKITTGINTAIQGGNYGRADAAGLKQEHVEHVGRWPANVILTHAPGCQAVGTRRVKSGKAHRGRGGGNTFGGENTKPPMDDVTYADATGKETIEAWECVSGCPIAMLDQQSTGASRFYYCAKPSKAEKEAGLASFDATTAAELTGRKEGSAGLVMQHADGREKANPYAGTSGAVPRKNTHPTVKPIELLRYLVRLVTPAGGTVLDPFCGSGSCGIAAGLEGFSYIGIELDPEGKGFVDIARARIHHHVGPSTAVNTTTLDVSGMEPRTFEREASCPTCRQPYSRCGCPRPKRRRSAEADPMFRGFP